MTNIGNETSYNLFVYYKKQAYQAEYLANRVIRRKKEIKNKRMKGTIYLEVKLVS